MGLSTATVGEEFDGFYAAHFRDTVAMTYTLTADMVEAQDIAQEAFCRAWRRWPHIRGYDNPVAWVRRVAVNLARSRWRRLKTASARLAGLLRTEAVPELNPDHVAIVAALRKLPARQREALVLHHMMDLPVTEVAEHFEVPVGTVKSWLHRGRAALVEDLRIDVETAVTIPPVDRVKRRSRTRVVVSTALALIVAGAVAYVALHFGQNRHKPLPPLESPTPSTSPTAIVAPDDPMLKVDWSRATVTFLPLGDCPGGDIHISSTGGNTRATVSAGDGRPVGVANLDTIAIGDLDADGEAEAVMPMFCYPDGQLVGGVPQLAVFTRHDNGTIHLITLTLDYDRAARAMWIYQGVLYVHAAWDPPRSGFDALGELRAYRLATGALTRIGTAPYPAVTEVNLTPLAERLACGLAPSEPDVRLHFDSRLEARAGQREFTILRPIDAPLFVERHGRTGLPYLILIIGCRAVSEPRPTWDSTAVIFDRVGVEWRAVEVA